MSPSSYGSAAYAACPVDVITFANRANRVERNIADQRFTIGLSAHLCTAVCAWLNPHQRRDHRTQNAP